LFSLGSVLYTMCTGRPPFRADSSYGILRRITDNDPRPITDNYPSAPLWLVALIDQLLAKRVEQRFQSAERVAEIMEQCLAHLQQPGLVPIPSELGQRSRTRRLTVLALLTTAAVLLGSAAGYWQWQQGATPDTINHAATLGPSNVGTSSLSADTQPVDKQTQSDTSPKSAPWNDDVPQQIEQLRNQVQDLQQRVDLGWD
jgi:serine/threonine-protein kinase